MFKISKPLLLAGKYIHYRQGQRKELSDLWSAIDASEIKAAINLERQMVVVKISEKIDWIGVEICCDSYDPDFDGFLKKSVNRNQIAFNRSLEEKYEVSVARGWYPATIRTASKDYRYIYE